MLPYPPSKTALILEPPPRTRAGAKPFRISGNILTPKEESWDGHSPSADKLIKACGKWSRDLHEEIYVFDGGRWCKNHGLWTAVQQASWDDVILDPSMKETLVNDVHGFFDSRAVYEEYSVRYPAKILHV